MIYLVVIIILSGSGVSYRECIALEGLFELFAAEEKAAEWFEDTRCWGDLRCGYVCS